MSTKPCVDCVAEGVTTRRPTNGAARKPRCVTHQRAWKKRAAANAHGQRIKGLYGITVEEYWELYEAQGGRCAICGIANGTTRRLAVDHDHQTDEVRGLLCGPDNIMIGRLRRGGLLRAINYLDDPPARKVLIDCYPPGYPELGG